MMRPKKKKMLCVLQTLEVVPPGTEHLVTVAFGDKYQHMINVFTIS